MALRTPPASLTPPPSLAELTKDQAPQDAIAWQTYDIELVTPMYGGGVVAGEVDKDYPIRPTAIRGQLRFWWRFLAKHKYGMPPEQIRDEEALLWGGFYVEKEGKDRGKKKPKASLVFVQVRQPEKKDIKSHTEYKDVPYAIFPAREPNKEGKKEKVSVTLLKENTTWQLGLGIAKTCSPSQCQSVTDALRWWLTFGGVGARIRRGFGAIRALPNEHSPKLNLPVSQQEVTGLAKGKPCHLVFIGRNHQDTTYNSAMSAWSAAVDRLASFRQGSNIGRNGKMGRSHWPEAASIRKAADQSRLKADDKGDFSPEENTPLIYPRAFFGLPIIFHFKNITKDPDPEDENYLKKPKKGLKYDPDDTTLSATIKGVTVERMGSPVMIRPYLSPQGEWLASALFIPSELTEQTPLILKYTKANIKRKIPFPVGRPMPGNASESQAAVANNQKCPLLYNRTPAQIAQEKLANPLDAFRHYFVEGKKA